MRQFYHATPMRNLSSILDKGLLVGFDGITYLAETPQDACKFIALWCFGEPILVIEVELDESKVKETFDHNPNFFRCKAFGYPDTIPVERMTNFWKFEK